MIEKVVDIVLGKAYDFFSLEKKINTLETNINLLKSKAADVQVSVEEAKLSSRKKRKREVEEWLKEVENKNEEFESLKVDFKASRFYSRIELAKRADQMISETANLTQQGEFSGGILLDLYEEKEQPLLAAEGKGRAFKENLEEIWRWIMNDEISSIGIYGMGGVGKTTLATHIYNNLLKEVRFNHVYWVTVSQENSIPQLQNKIATAIHLDLSDEDERKRAAKIFHVLKQRAKFVLILDDVWTYFNLEKIGISLGEGSKLVITSRSLDVCRKIGCQKKIKVKPLDEEEAWLLFLEKLGRDMELHQDVEEIAKSMAKKCSGLPLGIITVAGSMKGLDDIHEWRNAWEELQEASIRGDDEVYQVLLYSFNRLKDQRLVNCFLYCSLYPDDYPIPRDELIRLFILEGLMDTRSSRQKEIDQGHDILNRLENVGLLENTVHIFWYHYEDVKCVKMHDLVRDMAKKLTKANPKYMAKAGIGLEEIPGDSEWEEDLEKVSLMDNKISLIPLGISPKCPRLSTLILGGDCSFSRIPNSFFDHLCGLKVLDLSGNSMLEELPNCLSNLESLTALLLRNCMRLCFLPKLGKLKALRELDLYQTAIKDVPEGLEKLVNLRCLCMSYTKLKMIPEGIVSKLSSLQSLRISADMLPVQVEEVAALKQLEQFEGCFPNVHYASEFFNLYASSKRPRFYNIFVVEIGDVYIPIMGHENSDKVDITDKRVILHSLRMGENVVVFPEDMQQLQFRYCTGLGGCLTDAFSLCNIQRRGLIECVIKGNDEIRCIMKLSSSNDQLAPSAPLQSLEHLSLFHLPNFVGLLEWESFAFQKLPNRTFSCLRSLYITHCGRITKLFTSRLLQNLQNLEEIDAQYCDMLKEIIADEEGCSLDFTSTSSYHGKRATTISLPKLKKLNLHSLQRLRNICKGTMICNSIESIFIKNCPYLQRLPLLQPSPPAALKKIILRPVELQESLKRDPVLEPFVC